MNKKFTFLLLFIILFFFILIYFFIDCMVKKNTKEEFDNQYNSKTVYTTDINDSDTYSLDPPLTTTTSCQNFCSPTSRCAITGQQCFADIDCPGCQKNTPSYSTTSFLSEVPGQNFTGKLSNYPLQYSELIINKGIPESEVISNNNNNKAPTANFGENTWKKTFNMETKLFDSRYKTPNLIYEPNYSNNYSLIGSFIDEGPLPSNSVL